jgi:hypothetical protein
VLEVARHVAALLDVFHRGGARHPHKLAIIVFIAISSRFARRTGTAGYCHCPDNMLRLRDAE